MEGERREGAGEERHGYRSIQNPKTVATPVRIRT